MSENHYCFFFCLKLIEKEFYFILNLNCVSEYMSIIHKMQYAKKAGSNGMGLII